MLFIVTANHGNEVLGTGAPMYKIFSNDTVANAHIISDDVKDRSSCLAN